VADFGFPRQIFGSSKYLGAHKEMVILWLVFGIYILVSLAGSLIQIPSDKPRTSRSRLTNFKSEKETVRQCFLFSNHLILATR